MRSVVSHVQQRLVGRERDTVAYLDTGVDNSFFTIRLMSQTFAWVVGIVRRRIGDVDVPVMATTMSLPTKPSAITFAVPSAA